ncbi:MAG TPA: glycoside hydrolase family 16 protein [Verrucomicrobiae bacterium]
MKTFLFTLGLFILAANGVAAEDWKLVWSDEFNYTGLPDTNKWGYEEGFVRNHETQYYTLARLENARVEDGHLVIECRKEHFTPPDHAPVDYTSASLITLHQESWRYGRIEVRAKLPSGQGVWPAIWMLGTNITQVGWPRCGEIDIMEFIGKDPGGIHGTLHYAMDGKHQSDGGTLETNLPSAGYHVYAVEWTPERIDFYYDATKYHSVLLDKAGTGAANPFRQPQYLILNFAIGGEWGGPIDDMVLPQKFLIDYVRVYQPADSQ